MPEQVPFIGRKNEIKKINNFIEKRGERLLICIHGEGGIGKTRLLQEIAAQQQRKQDIQVTQILDFDDQSLLNPETMNRKIANMLDSKTFESFFRAQVDYHKMRTAGVSSERLDQESLKVNQVFAESLNTVSSKKAVMLFFDTTDHLEEETGVWKDLEIKVPFLKNIVILMAGRNARSIGESLQRTTGSHVEIINLSPLPRQESQDYLQQKQQQIHITIEPDLAEKLLMLSGGRPILLDLAVEWKARGISLGWLFKSSLEEIQAFGKEWQKEFEKDLVSHIMDMRSPMDQIVLLMSYIYPLNIRMISEVLKDENAQKLFKEAISYVFVKLLPGDYISLHDEMRRLVNEYVWPEVDPNSDRRRWYSERALQYLTDEIKNLTQEIEGRRKELRKVEKNERYTREALGISLKIQELEQRVWILREQQMDHTLFTNLDEGVKVFETLFDEATKRSRFVLRKKFFDKLQGYTEKLSPKQNCILNIHQVQLFFDDGKYQQAKELCESVLERKDISSEHKVDAQIKLANIKVRLGHVKESVADFEKAVNISGNNELSLWQVKAYNALGYACRLIDDLENAQTYYQKARHLYWQGNESDRIKLRDVYGWISNNLAFVLSYKNETRRTAINIARSTLDSWRSIGNDIGLGAGYLVLGIAYYRSDLAVLGLEAFQKALDIFQPLKHNDWLGQIYSWRGALYQDMAKQDIRNLDNAEKDLQKALEIGTPNIKAMTLNRLGRVYMSQQKWELAEEKLLESLEHARQIPDYKYWVSSVGRLAAIASERKEYYRLDEFRQMLNECLKKIDYPEKNALGVIYFGLAKLALGQNNPNTIDSIVEFLEEGISLVTEFGSYARTDILTRLALVEKDFHKIDAQIIRSIGQKLTKYISAKELEDVDYSIVIPVMYRWANWRREDVIDE